MKYFVIVLCIVGVGLAADTKKLTARIESCRGCSLNRLPEVKRFIQDDVQQYEGVEVKYISGAPPELVMLGEHDEELERLPLSQLTRQQCNDLLLEKGFHRTSKNSEF